MPDRKIALISLSTPTFNNVGAASALPYHLIMGARECGATQFEVWSFNINNIGSEGVRKSEDELGVKIHIVGKPWWYRWMFRLHMAVLRVLLHYPLLSYFKPDRDVISAINRFAPDTVWIYGEELAGLTALFPGRTRIVTMPDCETLYYHRVLTMNFLTEHRRQVMRYSLAYWQYRSMDRRNSIPGVRYHFVGKADAEFYRGINPMADAVFLPHPHYAWRKRTIQFHSPKIRLLFAGRYDFYCRHGSDHLLSAMLAAGGLREQYEVTFLGKGWEQWCRRLSEAGWTASHIGFAQDYINELQRHDIQVNAIDLGTGTKGKVLDAITNGLLAFGTPYAMENISVESGVSCIVYRNTDEAIAALRAIAANPQQYERMAEKGRDEVLRVHNRARIAGKLFG